MSDVAQALDTNGRPAFDVVRQGPSELVLRGELDLSTVPVFRAALSEVPTTERVTLDLAELTFIDSTGIHALVQYARQVDGGAPLTLVNASDWVLRLLEITGLRRSPLFELRNADVE